MKFEPGNIYFNGVYIIQSLREGDKKTGQELYDDIISRRTSNSLIARVDNISNREELFAHFSFVQRNIKNGIIPYIHFETHGFKDGIQLSDGAEISWIEMVPYLRQINLLTKNNLFVSMASCQGGNIQFCVKITEPSPFRGFIGPMDNVGEIDLLNSYNEFFNVLLLKNDFELAIEALNATSRETKYHHMNVEAFFDVVMEYQKTLELNNPSLIEERIEYLLSEQIKRDPTIIIAYGGSDALRKSICL